MAAVNTTSNSDTVHRNLMVNYIPSSWTSVELQTLFQQFGPLEDAKVIMDKATNASRGFGFVKFQNREDAENAISQAQGMQVEGKRLKILKAELGRAPAGSATIYLAGFDPNTFGMNELNQLFAPYGNVSNIRIHNSQPGKKGVAFVSMDSMTEAFTAAEALNGVSVGSDTLTVRIAEASAKQLQQQQMGVQGKMAGAGREQMTAGRFQPYGKRPQAAQMLQLQPQMQAQMQYQLPLLAQQMQSAQQLQFLQYPGLMQPQVQAETPQTNHCLFVYGVRGMDEAFLMKLCGQFGAITDVKAPAGKNYGFVNMPNYAEAVNAVNTLNGAMLQGATEPLQISFKDSSNVRL